MNDRDRFDKFTEHARRVLSLAQEEAQRFQHNYIGTEHLLLGLVREGEGVAAKVLANLGVELNKIRSAVEFIIGRGDRIVLGEIALTPRAKKVIELAVDEAHRLNHHYIGTEHLLLGLVREGEGIGAGVLESLGVNLEKVRTQVIVDTVSSVTEQSAQSSALMASDGDRFDKFTESEAKQVVSSPKSAIKASQDSSKREEKKSTQQPLSVFYSYADADESLREQLEKHLSLLHRQGLISGWHKRKIPPGKEWDRDIDDHLETASIVLLLISADFLASDYCYDIEMQRALERHKQGEVRVIPIILRPCDWQSAPFAYLECLPAGSNPVIKWEDPDEAFSNITERIRQVIEKRPDAGHSRIVLSETEQENRVRLLRRVRNLWITRRLEQSLPKRERIALTLQEQSDALSNYWSGLVQEMSFLTPSLPDETSIVQIYDASEGGLLILGEPGAGKTILLLELARALLERAERDQRMAIPVIFILSSWARKQQPIGEWLVEELSDGYRIEKGVGKSLLEKDHILPFLDGLDELPRNLREKCSKEINNYFKQKVTRSMVVSSRSADYLALQSRLELSYAVSIQPLTDEQIEEYLQQTGRQLNVLQRVLQEDAEMKELARQPLMLNMLSQTYQDASAASLLIKRERGSQQKHLFADYVKRMLERRGESKHWPPDKMVKWLTFLASRMHEHHLTVFTIEDLQVHWLPRRQRIFYWPSVVLLIGPILGLLVYIITRLPIVLYGQLLIGALAGLFIWLFAWLITTLSSRSRETDFLNELDRIPVSLSEEVHVENRVGDPGNLPHTWSSGSPEKPPERLIRQPLKLKRPQIVPEHRIVGSRPIEPTHAGQIQSYEGPTIGSRPSSSDQTDHITTGHTSVNITDHTSIVRIPADLSELVSTIHDSVDFAWLGDLLEDHWGCLLVLLPILLIGLVIFLIGFALYIVVTQLYKVLQPFILRFWFWCSGYLP